MSQPFRFKQFHVFDHSSTMKVGTDAVLLGAWVRPPQTGSILDIGTGSGVIALMMAQKTGAFITAIDIHEPSIRQASENFSQSPWPGRLIAINISLENHVSQNEGSYDFVIANPPFFINSLKPKKQNLHLAKHSETGFISSFMDAIARLLRPEGQAAVIIPAHLQETFLKKNAVNGMFPVRIAHVFSKPDTAQTRVMIVMGKGNICAATEEKIYILDADNNYTGTYKSLTSDYYLFLSE